MQSQREQLNEKLKKIKAKAIFYRTPKIPDAYSRYATVCLLLKGKKVIARGISVCSPLDAFDGGFGRDCSLGRAIKATIHRLADGEGNQNDTLPITRFDAHLDHIYDEFKDDERTYQDDNGYQDTGVLKACYNPVLTNFEEELVKRFLNPRPKEDKAAA